MQSWQEYLVRQKVIGSAFDTFTTAKTVLNTSDLRTIPADFFEIGRSLDIKITGGISNIVTTPGTIVFQIMLGSTIAFTTGAIQLNASAHTFLPFWLDIMLTCRAVGSGTSANLVGQGKITGIMPTVAAGQVDGGNTMATLMVPATAHAVGTGFNSTIANVLDLFVGFSISNVGNAVKIEQYDVKFAG